MPVDNFGRYFGDQDNPAWNRPDLDPPPIPAHHGELARIELAGWGVRQRHARRPPPVQEEQMDSNRRWLKKYPQLDVSSIKPIDQYTHGVNLAPFRVEYDSHEQITQKLTNSVILLKGWPFQVTGTIALEAGGYALLVSDIDTKMHWVDYKDVSCLRSLAPGYINYQSQAFWVYRIPDRQNQQGLTSRNTMMKPAGPEGRTVGMHANIMLACLHSRKNIPFQTNLLSLMENNVIQSVRLSNNLALHKIKNKGAAVGVEYIGRPLGIIVEGRLKVLDDADLGPTWIYKDCMDVNLELF